MSGSHLILGYDRQVERHWVMCVLDVSFLQTGDIRGKGFDRPPIRMRACHAHLVGVRTGLAELDSPRRVTGREGKWKNDPQTLLF